MLTSQKLIEKSEVYDLLLPWLGDGLLLASGIHLKKYYIIFFNWPDYVSTILGQKWRKNRRLLTPAFHFQILGHFFDVFHKNAEILCEQLSKESFNKEIDVMPYMKRCTLDVICGNLSKERYTSLSIKHTFYICHLKKKRPLWEWKSMHRLKTPPTWQQFTSIFFFKLCMGITFSMIYILLKSIGKFKRSFFLDLAPLSRFHVSSSSPPRKKLLQTFTNT